MDLISLTPEQRAQLNYYLETFPLVGVGECAVHPVMLLPTLVSVPVS